MVGKVSKFLNPAPSGEDAVGTNGPILLSCGGFAKGRKLLELLINPSLANLLHFDTSSLRDCCREILWNRA
jgi:hypothetical protein